MKKLLQFLLDGCWHKWQDILATDLTTHHASGFKATSTRYYSRCIKCGAHRVWDTK